MEFAMWNGGMQITWYSDESCRNGYILGIDNASNISFNTVTNGVATGTWSKRLV